MILQFYAKLAIANFKNKLNLNISLLVEYSVA